MRVGVGENQFDLSELDDRPVDKLDAIMDVAASVLLDYAPDQGTTRIERMARWIALNFGDQVDIRSAGMIARMTHGMLSVECAGDLIGIVPRAPIPLSSDDARWLSILLLRAAEFVEAQ